MTKHGKKMIAPVVVTACVLVYLGVYFGILIGRVGSAFLKIVYAAVPALAGAAMVGVCVQRIREIKGGEEDDLGQY